MAALVTAVVAGIAMVPGTASAGLNRPGGTKVDGKYGDGGYRTISLPNKSDLEVNIITAVDRDTNGRVWGSIQLTWYSDGFGSGHKFDGFQIVSRLERRSTRTGSDGIIKEEFCDVKRYVNDKKQGVVICYTDLGLWNTNYYWSGDGYLQWDVDNDGKGWQSPWHVHGSPLLS